MSWSFQRTGTLAALRAALDKEQAHGDPSQFEAAKQLIAAELAAWPTASPHLNGVQIEACGHHDSLSRNLVIKLTQVKLELDAPPAGAKP